MMKFSNAECLIDTNILVYFLDRTSPFFTLAAHTLDSCASGKIKGVIAHQNLLELSAVLDRVYKLPRKEIANNLKSFAFKSNFNIINPTPETFGIFIRLLEDKTFSHVVDLYLAATALDNNVKTIITFNKKDFKGVEKVNAINPKELFKK